MENQAQAMLSTPRRESWNKGKLIGQKPPLRPKHVWSIRTRLQMEGRTRDLAMFNPAIDSKLRQLQGQSRTGFALLPLRSRANWRLMQCSK
jgi:hypothetical protein